MKDDSPRTSTCPPAHLVALPPVGRLISEAVFNWSLQFKTPGATSVSPTCIQSESLHAALSVALKSAGYTELRIRSTMEQIGCGLSKLECGYDQVQPASSDWLAQQIARDLLTRYKLDMWALTAVTMTGVSTVISCMEDVVRLIEE